MTEEEKSSHRRVIAYKGHLSRAFQTCELECQKTPVNNIGLQFCINKINTAWSNYESAFHNYELLVKLTDDSYQAHAATETKYQDCVVKLQTLMLPPPVQPNPNPTHQPTAPNLVPKLKTLHLEVPKFNGDRKRWPVFWATFESLIHQNKDLSNVLKFAYLQEALQGEAADRIQGFTGVNNEYQEAVDLLSKVYADSNAIQYDLTSKLLSIQSPTCDPQSLSAFQIAFTGILRQLKSSVTNLDDSEWLIRVLLQNKLPESFIKVLYNRFHTNYFTVEQIDDAISDYVKQHDNNQNSVRISSPSHNKLQVRQTNNSQTTVASILTPPLCIFCQNNHPSRVCPNFSTVESRRNKLEQMRKCSRCTQAHDKSTCQIQFSPCKTCGKTNHHGFFCYKFLNQSNPNFQSNSNVPSKLEANNSNGTKPKIFPKSKSTIQTPTLRNSTQGHAPSNYTRPQREEINSQINSAVTNPPQVSNNANSISINCLSTSRNQLPQNSHNFTAALPTAKVKVFDKSHKFSTVRAFFDQGSQKSFITRSLKDSLQLSTVDTTQLTLSCGFDIIRPTDSYEIVKLVVTLGKRTKRITALVVENLPSSIHTPGLVHAAKQLKKSKCSLADDFDSDVVTNIELLIGSDYYGRFVSGITNQCGIDLIQSSAGYLIYGPIPSGGASSNAQVSQVVVARLSVEPSPCQLISNEIDNACTPVHKLWDLDAIGIDATAPYTQDTETYQRYLQTITKESNQYFVRLPWKKNHDPLPNNFKKSLGQLHSMIKSLSQNPIMLDHYDSIIKEQLQSNFIERVKNPRVTNHCHYIPHHAVTKDSATTPIRIVYNCSAKASKDIPSLNDCLMKGPSLTEKLSDLLLLFRTNPFAFSADISKAFLRIGLQREDRDFTRFLWLENPHNPQSELITYRFSSVLFGATSSPFLLQATLDYHLNQSSSPYKELLSRSFYVDNLQSTTGSESELLSIYQSANSELNDANMPLREWSTNNPTLKSQIQSDMIGAQSTEVNLLGLKWDTINDHLRLNEVSFSNQVLTKRKLLSAISSVFDPLGLFTPCTILAKQLLQSVWKLNIPWDQDLPQDIVDQWTPLSNQLPLISDISVPRQTCSVNTSCALVVFCDASIKAYGAAAYLISDNQANLLVSKARVAPLKQRTLPQLELTALQVGVQLTSYIINTLSNIRIERSVVYSDNEAALQWVRNDSSSITYVKNRVHHIREHISKYSIELHHVLSQENPADMLSRGITVTKFQQKFKDFWFKGPTWLKDPSLYPIQKPLVVVNEITTDHVASSPNIPKLFDPERYSRFKTVIGITAYVFKFLRLKCPLLGLPTPEEYWIKHAQRTYYPQVYSILSSHCHEGSPLQQPSLKFINDLGLYMDHSNIIKSASRLKHSQFHSNDQILLPSKAYVTKLIIMQVHQTIKHGGMSETLTELRNQFWLPKGRMTVKQVLHSCFLCRKLKAKPIPSPGPPPLPRERVNYTRPFECVGVDFTGSIIIRDENVGELAKVYVCLFTCAATRAVHLELAKDMTAETFIILFRRFCARCSVPKLVISDNGTNFTASAAYFKSLFSDPQVQSYFSDLKLQWKFIAPRAPWQGGFYERLVGVVKNCLKRTLYKRTLNWDELVTVLLEVEQCVNNRPLTYVESEYQDLQPLTPNHLLRGTCIQIMPSIIQEDIHDPLCFDHQLLNESYSRLSQLLLHFKQMWAKDYLASLKEKHFGNTKPQQGVPVNSGDIVLVHCESPRNNWPLGRITKIFPDPDGIVRTVEVFFQNHTSLRTLDKLYPLELSTFPDDSQVLSDDDKAVPIDRPIRESARRAAAHRQELIQQDLL